MVLLIIIIISKFLVWILTLITSIFFVTYVRQLNTIFIFFLYKMSPGEMFFAVFSVNKLIGIPGQVVYLHDTIANCAYLYVPRKNGVPRCP